MTDSETFNIYYVDVKSLKIKNYIFIGDRPCQITNIHQLPPGKHGYHKYTIQTIDLQSDEKYFTGKNAHEDILQFEPIIEICQYRDIGDKKFVNKVDIDNEERFVKILSFPKSEDKLIVLHKIYLHEIDFNINSSIKKMSYDSFPDDINANKFKDEKLIKFRKEITDLVRKGIFPITYDFGIHK